jgi:hypothetical protein
VLGASTPSAPNCSRFLTSVGQGSPSGELLAARSYADLRKRESSPRDRSTGDP